MTQYEEMRIEYLKIIELPGFEEGDKILGAKIGKDQFLFKAFDSDGDCIWNHEGVIIKEDSVTVVGSFLGKSIFRDNTAIATVNHKRTGKPESFAMFLNDGIDIVFKGVTKVEP